MVEFIIFTASIGNFQMVVSQESIKESGHCNTLLNISEVSALVGNGFCIIVSNK
jgi:hypothetical protein